MSFGPHPYTLTKIAGQRQADVHAQVDHLRLAKLAQTTTDRRRPRLDRHALRAIAMVPALLAAFHLSACPLPVVAGDAPPHRIGAGQTW
jgi:hypothetical protein